jgi:hypothetical protein
MTEDTQKVSHSTTEFKKNEGIVPMQRKIQLRKTQNTKSEHVKCAKCEQKTRSGRHLKLANRREQKERGGRITLPRRVKKTGVQDDCQRNKDANPHGAVSPRSHPPPVGHNSRGAMAQLAGVRSLASTILLIESDTLPKTVCDNTHPKTNGHTLGGPYRYIQHTTGL